MRRVFWITAFACCGMEAFAQEPGDIAAGHQFAHQWCSECHQIDATRGRADLDAEEAPSFVEVANDPSTTPLSLRVFFQSNHENMPNLHISPSQADDLAAYILSLKQK
jgi:mono/diheme cytochrome c family protein